MPPPCKTCPPPCSSCPPQCPWCPPPICSCSPCPESISRSFTPQPFSCNSRSLEGATESDIFYSIHPLPCSLSFANPLRTDSKQCNSKKDEKKAVEEAEEEEIIEIIDRICDMLTARKRVIETRLFKNTVGIIELLQQKLNFLVLKLLGEEKDNYTLDLDPDCLEDWVEHLVYKRRIEGKLTDATRIQLLFYIHELIKYWEAETSNTASEHIVTKDYLDGITFEEVHPMCEAVTVILKELVLDTDIKINEVEKLQIEDVYKLLTEMSQKINRF